MANERLSKEGYVLQKGECQRKNGLFYYRWTDETGIRRGFYADSLDELRILEKRLHLIEQKRQIEYCLSTINDVFQLWSDVKCGVQENTMYNYRQVYNTHVRKTLGKKRILEIRATDIKRFYYALHDTKRLSYHTLDHIQNVLYQVLQLAVDDGYLPNNPAANALKELKREKQVPRKEIEVLEVEQERDFLQFCKKTVPYKKWYPLFTVMLGSGMRVGEICALRHEDVDFNKNVINVRQTLSVSGAGRKIHLPKTNAGYRQIPMISSVRKALLMEKRYQDKNVISCRETVDGYSDFFFLNRFGNMLNQQSINRAIQRAVIEYNCKITENGQSEKKMIPFITSHVFRKTFITRMCESGMNIRDIMKIAGHADIQTTMSVYTKVTERMRQADLKKLENYMNRE